MSKKDYWIFEDIIANGWPGLDPGNGVVLVLKTTFKIGLWGATEYPANKIINKNFVTTFNDQSLKKS